MNELLVKLKLENLVSIAEFSKIVSQVYNYYRPFIPILILLLNYYSFTANTRTPSNVLMIYSSVRIVPVPDDPHARAGHQRGGDCDHVRCHARHLHRHATARWHAR